MKHGILVFMGNVEEAGDVAAAAERAGLGAVSIAPYHIVFANGDLPIRTLPDSTIILGDIFPFAGGECLTPGDGWGNFLAIASSGPTIRIDRAPLTGMPLFWGRFRSGVICVSDVALLKGLVPDVAIDWDFVAETLTFINLRTARTGLAAFAELLPGSRLQFDGARASVSSIWSPWPHVAAAPSLRFSDLANELEQCILRCVDAWSASRGDIILELSGGLDSSIVAAALRAAEANYSAITFATPGADGDERHFARIVAAHCGIDLVEVEHDEHAIDLVAMPDAVSARPEAYSVLGGLDRAFESAVPDHAKAVFGGIGGDSVFDFDGTVAPILDVLHTFGPGTRAFGTLRDIARSSGATLWEAARLSWRAHRAGPRIGWRRDAQYLDERQLPVGAPRHPWDDGAEAASQAKRNHVESIWRILDFLDRPARWHDRDVVAPLLSQPVVELCLSIPSWAWFTGGRNRAVARAGFAGRLPAEIIWRKGKGRLESMCAAAYLRQRTQLKELLLGGLLAERGLLDLPSIEAYLGRDLAEGDFDYFRLIEIGDVERWIRSAESAFRGPSLDQRRYCATLAGSGSISPLSQ